MRDAQALLDRAGCSPGQIDGAWGRNSKIALAGFQQLNQLPITGEMDAKTWALLVDAAEGDPFTTYSVTELDLAGPFTPDIPSDYMEQSLLPGLYYRDVLEALGEKFHVSPALLKKMNPQAQFIAGEQIVVPNVYSTPPSKPASAEDAVIYVQRSTSAVTVQHVDGTYLFFAPVTTGSEHDPLPVGEWKVNGVERNPPFYYNPGLFWDANTSHTKARIPPGPNNPVGLVWIDLSKEHYGLHGTPEPGKIGHTQSHGCVRLTNWDALELADLVRPGMKVLFIE